VWVCVSVCVCECGVCVCVCAQCVTECNQTHHRLPYSEQVYKVTTKISKNIKLSYYMSVGQSVA